MARLITLMLLLGAGAAAQDDQDRQIREAGVCARCHVISVVEWGISKHWKAGTSCISCHGESKGHVIDERNNVKPEKLPHAAAIAGLCADCHSAGCPKSKKTTDCQTCHHVHALVDPKAPPKLPDSPAAVQKPGRAVLRVPQPRLELNANGQSFGLTLLVGGEVDLGDARLQNAKPVHTVRVAPFYLGVAEVTRAQWNAVMQLTPPSSADASKPAGDVSWDDAQEFLRRINAASRGEAESGAALRLPTEAEWEFAARPSAKRASAKPILAEPASMLGGVWEWCSSIYRPYPYDAGDGRESLTSPGLRVLRGGSSAEPASWVTPATRHGERANRRLPYNGLRLARSAE